MTGPVDSLFCCFYSSCSFFGDGTSGNRYRNLAFSQPLGQTAETGPQRFRLRGETSRRFCVPFLVENRACGNHQLCRFIVEHGRVDGSMPRKRLYAFKPHALAGEVGKTGMAEPVRGNVGAVHEDRKPFLDHMIESVPLNWL